MSIRKIKKIVNGQSQIDGAGVKLVRVVGYPDVVDFDPFLMLDAFDSNNAQDYIKGFPWHPHRGIETVTYLISGDIEHADSLGNKGSILDGCCQWMTAGSGILHQEMPQPTDRMFGVQLWLNLPRGDKMTNPQYRDIKNESVPEIIGDGHKVRVISGDYLGTLGVAEGDYVKMLFLDVNLEPGKQWRLETENDATLFIYIVQGEGCFDDSNCQIVNSKSAVLFHSGNQLFVNASDKGIRFLLFSGMPLKEPIAWGGPIVMNTQQELQKAFKELDDNTFIK